MKDEYDFSKGQRGKFFNPKAKKSMPVYLEEDVLEYFSKKAEAKGITLDVLLNDLLKKDIALIEGVAG